MRRYKVIVEGKFAQGTDLIHLRETRSSGRPLDAKALFARPRETFKNLFAKIEMRLESRSQNTGADYTTAKQSRTYAGCRPSSVNENTT